MDPRMMAQALRMRQMNAQRMPTGEGGGGGGIAERDTSLDQFYEAANAGGSQGLSWEETASQLPEGWDQLDDNSRREVHKAWSWAYEKAQRQNPTNGEDAAGIEQELNNEFPGGWR